MLLTAIISEDFPCCFPFFCFMLAILVMFWVAVTLFYL
ncbi:hypothetical protein SLEP1_g58004 [Rubroshorea leprosula]|uniref:ATP synthase F0 subunit 8 n=1 Tax=Rubroshorea leprosula TaxID=152421 RepID=A0AAV5MMV1_9ROSI|nr:hypothetical protein SLEP1_g58004 [Rubroshorea leprosula]